MKLYLSLLLLLLLASCQKSATTTTNSIDILPRETLLNIPTYDGSGQCVHPDILFLNPPLRGNKFLLAFTPYPYYDGRKENPSILASRNGIDFYEEKQGLNPLVSAPTYDHNDDPDLLYDPDTKRYVLYYLETMRPDSENVIRMESTDALSWTRRTVLHYDLHQYRHFIVSPAVCRLPAGGYVMYQVNLSHTPFQIEWLSSTHGQDWNLNLINPIISDLSDTLVPWHLDIMAAENKYFMLLSCRINIHDSQHQLLMFGESSDLLHWHFHPKPLISSQPSFHNCLSIYRSTGLISDHKLAVWYSMVQPSGIWRIGVEKFDMDTI